MEDLRGHLLQSMTRRVLADMLGSHIDARQAAEHLVTVLLSHHPPGNRTRVAGEKDSATPIIIDRDRSEIVKTARRGSLPPDPRPRTARPTSACRRTPA